jgi:hypothetical protein
MFMQSEPIGEERMDWRLAVLTSLFANVNRQRGTAPYSAGDFVYLPELAVIKQEEQDNETVEDIARAWGAV